MRSWKIDGLVREPHEVVVHVTELVRQRLGNLVELAAREPRDRVALRHDHPPQRRYVALEVEDPLDERRLGPANTSFSTCRAGRPACRLPAGSCRPSCRQCDRGARPGPRRARVRCGRRFRRFARSTATSRCERSREYCGPRKKSTSCVRNACSLALKSMPCRIEIEVVAVGLDLGMMDFRQRVLDGQLVKVEDLGEDFGVGLSGFAQVHPHPDSAVGLQPGRVHPIDSLGGPVFVFVDRDQSPTLTCSAACAAARRATGTRYGEQLT